jgi:hypothetical protein
VAEKLGGQEQEIWTALFLMLLLGVLGALVVSLLSPWLVLSALKTPEALQPKALYGFCLLVLSISAVVISPVLLLGVLEALRC